MNIPDIDFTRIRSMGPGGQRDGYEQFICQQVAQESPASDSKFVSLHGAGGDGGVECYWTLVDGSEHGWQAKYWTDHGDVNKSQLDKSVKAALDQHPKLTRYTIAIPTDPTGPTGGRGTSLLEKIHDSGGWLEGWQKMATDRSLNVKFELEWETNIVTRLNRLDASGVQRRFWFDVDVLPRRWWDDRLEEAVAAARPRYTPELNIQVPAAQSIAALCSDDEWWQVVLDQVGEVSKAVDQLRYAAASVLAADLDAVRTAAATVTDALNAWHTSRASAGLDNVAQALDGASAIVRGQVHLEVAAMDEKYENWDSESWRQWQREYMVRFPAAAVDALRELGARLATATGVLVSPVGRLAGTQVALMTGPAGIGKTYLAIDAVERRLAQGRPSVVLHGRWFTNHEPLAHLRDLLQMPSDLTSEETIALLDEGARLAGTPALLVIDALNDTRPRSLWRDNLERLISVIGRYPRVRLLLTARTHYVGQVLPNGLDLPRFEHTGFEGVEFEAVSEYAAFYGLEAPTSPPIHGEFDNPLYLRLVCEALRANNRLSLDQANMGLDELAKMVLDNANVIISDRIDASPSDRVVHRAMDALAKAIADEGGSLLNRMGAQGVLTPIWSDISGEKSLLDALIAQGLVEEDVIPDGSPYGADIIAITFERIGHHLIVSDALAGVTDAAGVRDQLAGRLGRLMGLGGTIDVGILEATSVVVSERLGLELTDFEPEIGNLEAIAAATIVGTGWRSALSITDKTADIILDGLTREDSFDAGLTMLFRIAARPGHPLNADFLHQFLSTLDMGSRDQFLCGWLHTTHGTSGAVDRLIRWASEKPLHDVGVDTTRLWVTALLWTTSATDRRVREPATVGAARLLARHPGEAAGILERFGLVNDEWVVERALEVAYSALLANGSDADWAASAEIVWTNFFSSPSNITPNVAVRDAARCILEAANDRATLPEGVTAEHFRPPYTSAWPLEWPTEEDIAPYKTADYPKLVFSTTGDDFYRYKLEHDLRDRPGVDVAASARWIVSEVIRLGYSTEEHADFDDYVLGKYGRGRGKPPWIERIGKKYQWIALNRLIGHVSDHAPKKPNPWDPPPAPIPGPASTVFRQIDPTITEFEPADDAPRPWVPTYDWASTTDEPDTQWVADDTDLPNITITAASHKGRSFVVLAGYYEWNNGTDSSKRSRSIWTHIYTHLVNTVDLPVALADLEGQDLIGHDLSNFPQTDDGYVGEFPYGHHHGEMIHAINHESRHSLKVPTQPAAWDILGEYEYAPGNHGTISLVAPAPAFFGQAPGKLHWNGRNGWVDDEDSLVAVLRHSVNAGQNELLIDAGWLEQWLTAEQKSLIWVENTGKDVYRGFSGTGPFAGALTRSQVHSSTTGSTKQTSRPGWHFVPPRDE